MSVVQLTYFIRACSVFLFCHFAFNKVLVMIKTLGPLLYTQTLYYYICT